MKIAIRNFGPIASYIFDLKDDFVLIVGENNIGKSYAISLVYLVLKALVGGRQQLRHSRHFDFAYDDDQLPLFQGGAASEWLKKLEQDVESGGMGTTIDVTKNLASDFKDLLEQTLLPQLRESLYGTFNEVENLQNRLTDEPLELEIDEDDLRIIIGVERDRLVVKDVRLRLKYVVRCVKAVRTVKELGDTVWIYFPDGKSGLLERNYNVVFYRLFSRLFREAANTISDLHYLPASRSGLYQALSAFSQIVAELAKSRTLLSSRLVLPAIAIPLSDYFLKLSNIRPVPKTEEQSVFFQIATKIEEEVLRGAVRFDAKTKRLLFAPKGMSLMLDLSATSSMVSEISPIAAYFKYVLPRSDYMVRRPRDRRPKQVVIIEEPEAHLHPQLQTVIVTIFAEMARVAGIKVIMTSHSNYVFNKVNNLVISGAINRELFKAILFQRHSSGGIAKEIDVSAFGIEDVNFIDVGEALYEERVKLVQEKQEQARVREGSST